MRPAVALAGPGSPLVLLLAYALTFAFAFVITFAATATARVVCPYAGLIDRPDGPGGRKVHGAPLPTGAGIGIIVAYAVTLRLIGPRILPVGQLPDLRGFMLASALLAVIGLVDDHRSLRPGVKLFGQIVVALLLYAHGYAIERITNPLGGQIELGWWGLVTTVLWVVGLINALNLIDGLDGLAAGVAAIAAATLLSMGVTIVAQGGGEWALVFLSGTLMACCLAFLWFNRHPARLFLGDTGAMFLGFVLAVISLVSTRKSTTAIALLMPLICLGLPLIDTAMAVLRRWRGGMPLFRADKGHLHHRLLRLGLGHRQVVHVFYYLSVYLGLIAYTFVLIPYQYALLVFLLLGMGLLFGLRVIDYLEARHVHLEGEVGQLPPPAPPPPRARWLVWAVERYEALVDALLGPLAGRPAATWFVLAGGGMVLLMALVLPIEMVYARLTADRVTEVMVIQPAPVSAGACDVAGEIPPLRLRPASLGATPLEIDRRRTRVWSPRRGRFLPFQVQGSELVVRLYSTDAESWTWALARDRLLLFTGIPLVPEPLHTYGEVHVAARSGRSGLRIAHWDVATIQREGAVGPDFGEHFYRVRVRTMDRPGDHATNQAIPYLEGLDLGLTERSALTYAVRYERATALRGTVQALIVTAEGEEIYTWDRLGPDEGGRSGSWSTPLDDVALGRWYRRRIGLGDFAGGTLRRLFFMVNDAPDEAEGERATFYFDTVGVHCLAAPRVSLAKGR